MTRASGGIKFGCGVFDIVCGLVCIFNYFRYSVVMADRPLWLLVLLFGMVMIAVGAVTAARGWRKL